MTPATRRHSFGKDRRLLTAAHYKHVFDNVDCKQGGKYFTFLSSTNQRPSSRLGLVIAKRHIPLAVRRNKLKRALREYFRNDYEAQATLEAQYDIIVLAKSPSNSLSDSELHREIKRQWTKFHAKRLQLSIPIEIVARRQT